MYVELLSAITYYLKLIGRKNGALPGERQGPFKMEALHVSLAVPEALVTTGLDLSLQRK